MCSHKRKTPPDFFPVEEDNAAALPNYKAVVDKALIFSATDSAGKIIYASQKFIQLSQFSSDELIGNTHHILDSGHHPKEFFKNMWSTILCGESWRGEIKNKTKNGSYYWVDMVIVPVFDEKGNILQYLAIQNLITLQKDDREQLVLSRQELLKREKQLKQAQHIAKTGSWYLDALSDTLVWSDEAYNILEIPAGIPLTYDLFLEKVAPGDQLRVNDQWQAFLKGESFEMEYRIICSGGEKWIKVGALLEVGSSGELLSAVGTIQDITETKKIQDILKASESLYKGLFEESICANVIIDKKTLQYLEGNEASLSLYGYTKEELLQRTAYDIRIAEEHAVMDHQLANNFNNSDRSIRYHRKKDGTIIQVQASVTEIKFKGKDAYLINLNDMTENIRMQEELVNTKILREKEISQASMEAQEKYRGEIGRELHDNINQLLAASNLYLKYIRMESPAHSELIKKSIEITNVAIEEIRKLSWSLVPPSLNEVSLKEAIESIIPHIEWSDAKVEIDISIQENSLSEGLKINIYRIFQEQFNNIIKYAGASRVMIGLHQFGDLIVLNIYDNGNGFDRSQKTRGIGLSNIVRRAETYGGKVTIDSMPGKGCRIYIEFKA